MLDHEFRKKRGFVSGTTNVTKVDITQSSLTASELTFTQLNNDSKRNLKAVDKIIQPLATNNIRSKLDLDQIFSNVSNTRC